MKSQSWVNFDQENFSSWIRHSKLKVTGFQNTSLSQNTSADGWGVLNKCENGFDVVFKSDERLRNYYNFSYNGKIVYTQNDNRTPYLFNRVTPFKKHNGVWSAQGVINNKVYQLNPDGTITGFGNFSTEHKRQRRNVSQAEYNHYRRYGLGDSINRLNNIIEQTVRRVLREEIQKNRNSSLW